MSDRRLRWAILAVIAAALGALAPLPAVATQKFGPLQLSGNLQTQNLIRTPSVGNFEFVQNRNVARLHLDYAWIQAGKFYGKYDIPFIENSQLFLLWRGVYDSVYSTTPGFIPKIYEIHGKAYGGKNFYQYATQSGNFATGKKIPGDGLELSGLTHDERDAFKFENTLREAYADIKFRGVPLTVRAGRQQIVWGETDNFRMLDRANSLDLTWHLQQEIPVPAFGWDEIRRPFWMLKFLYDLGDVWKLSQNFLEWYWNPGDWLPAKQAYLPRPWGLPFYNPLDNPFDGVFIGGVCSGSRIRTPKVGGAPGDTQGICTQLMNGTDLFQQGDYHRNPMENSQVGVRYHAITPQGLEFTLNYYYQRWGGDDGTNYAPLRGLPVPENKAEKDALTNMIANGIFPAQAIAPYVHTVGVSANYSDETYTQAVLRLETVYDVGIPFFDVAKPTAIDTPVFPGVTKKNMWKGMIGFDRPTWIRWLNKKSTIFLTGQFFFHHLLDNPSCEGQNEAFRLTGGKPASVRSCLVGGLDLPSAARPGTASSTSAGSPAFRDKIRDWETLATFAMFTFYRGGSLVPVIGIAVDTTNQFNMEPFWNVNWFVTESFVFNLGQHYFVTPRGRSSPVFETWGLAGFNSGRSETSVRLTYQF